MLFNIIIFTVGVCIAVYIYRHIASRDIEPFESEVDTEEVEETVVEKAAVESEDDKIADMVSKHKMITETGIGYTSDHGKQGSETNNDTLRTIEQVTPSECMNACLTENHCIAAVYDKSKGNCRLLSHPIGRKIYRQYLTTYKVNPEYEEIRKRDVVVKRRMEEDQEILKLDHIRQTFYNLAPQMEVIGHPKDVMPDANTQVLCQRACDETEGYKAYEFTKTNPNGEKCSLIKSASPLVQSTNEHTVTGIKKFHHMKEITDKLQLLKDQMGPVKLAKAVGGAEHLVGILGAELATKYIT